MQGPPTQVVDGAGNRFELRAIACPTCKVDSTRVIGVRGGRTHRYGLGVETTVVQCRRCHLLYPNPFPIPVDSTALYADPDKYFAAHDRPAKVEQWRALIREARRKLGGPEALSLLDVGSGRGEMLEAARAEQVQRVVGLETSPSFAREARETFGVEVIERTIEAFVPDAAPASFDCVFLNAVLEHVQDPDSMIACAVRLLRPGALLYIDVPNEPHLLSLIANGLGRLRRPRTSYNLSPTFPPFHVFGFNPPAIRTLLEKHGLAVESLRIHATPHVPSSGRLLDAAVAFAGSQIMRIANLTGTASNMFIWARRSGAATPAG